MLGKIYIPNINFSDLKLQSFFTLRRPFLMASGWGNDVNNFKTWNIQNDNKTTFEYYQNIAAPDYVFCLRGGGNFSVRFYEP